MYLTLTKISFFVIFSSWCSWALHVFIIWLVLVWFSVYNSQAVSILAQLHKWFELSKVLNFRIETIIIFKTANFMLLQKLRGVNKFIILFGVFTIFLLVFFSFQTYNLSVSFKGSHILILLSGLLFFIHDLACVLVPMTVAFFTVAMAMTMLHFLWWLHRRIFSACLWAVFRIGKRIYNLMTVHIWNSTPPHLLPLFPIERLIIWVLTLKHHFGFL